MTGFDLQNSGMGSDRSTNEATTTARFKLVFDPQAGAASRHEEKSPFARNVVWIGVWRSEWVRSRSWPTRKSATALRTSSRRRMMRREWRWRWKWKKTRQKSSKVELIWDQFCPSKIHKDLTKKCKMDHHLQSFSTLSLSLSFLMGQSRPLFVYFCLFHMTQIKINW